jgi:hypothetical protein
MDFPFIFHCNKGWLISVIHIKLYPESLHTDRTTKAGLCASHDIFWSTSETHHKVILKSYFHLKLNWSPISGKVRSTMLSEQPECSACILSIHRNARNHKGNRNYSLLGVPTRDSQKVMPLTVYLMIFPSWTCENFEELHCNIAEGTVSFQCSLHLCLQSSSTFERQRWSPSSAATVAWCSAEPLHWRTTDLAAVLRSEQVIIW